MFETTQGQKMNTEEAANAIEKALESISNNLEKFLEVRADAPKKTNEDLHSLNRTPVTSIAAKQAQFTKNLAIVNEGRKDLQEAIQQSIERKLVSPEKKSF